MKIGIKDRLPRLNEITIVVIKNLQLRWETWPALGRKPELDEIGLRTEIENIFGSLGKALRFLDRFHGMEAVTAAFRLRKEDLTVYFALQQFEQRKT